MTTDAATAPTGTATAAPAAEASPASTLREQFLEARRTEIIEAAQRVFAKHGCDGASMQQIAKAAGVSAGNIYRYFPNKEALVIAVCEDCEAAVREKFAAASAANPSPLGALFALGDHAFGEIGAPGEREGTMLNLESTLVAARNDEFGPAVERQTAAVRDSLQHLVASAQEIGELDPSVDARAFGELLLAVTTGIELLSLQTNGNVDADGVWALLQRIVRKFGTEGGASDVQAARQHD
jgi:AcrR family transcriptional regulator